MEVAVWLPPLRLASSTLRASCTGLAQASQAPSLFAWTTRKDVPLPALFLTGSFQSGRLHIIPHNALAQRSPANLPLDENQQPPGSISSTRSRASTSLPPSSMATTLCQAVALEDGNIDRICEFIVILTFMVHKWEIFCRQ